MNYRLSDDIGYIMLFTCFLLLLSFVFVFFLQSTNHISQQKLNEYYSRGQTVKLYTSHTIKHRA